MEPAITTAPLQRAWAGLLVRRPRWSLTWRGWLLGMVTAAVVGVTGIFWVHPFLAVTRRAPAEVLVVDGWTPTSTLAQAADEFRSGSYQRVLVVRAVYDSTDKYESGRHGGDYVAELLVRYGVPADAVRTVFCSVIQRDRTYHSALAARDWLVREGLVVRGLVVATAGAHARRSRLIYEKAFGDNVKIGVVSLNPPTYDPRRWWRTSEGIREVISETAAYGYVRLFFHP